MGLRIAYIIFTIGGFLSSPIFADNDSFLAIHAGTLIAMPPAPTQKKKTIVIRNNKIESILDGFQAPKGAQIIDLSQKFVLPGLIDCHVHLDTDKGGNERLLAAFTESKQLQAYEAMLNATKTIQAGFTTVRNLGGNGTTIALREAIKRGWIDGPRILDAASSISTTAGHNDRRLAMSSEVAEHFNDPTNICDGADDCRRAVRQQIANGADVIKVAITGGVNSPIASGLGAQMFSDEIKAIVDTAHLYQKKVAAHAHGDDGIHLALLAGVDSIEHGTMMTDENVKHFKKSGAYYVPTLSTVNGYIERLSSNPKAYPPEVREKIEWRIGITGKSLEKAVKGGVKIAFGTDAGVSKHGKNADEFELMVKHGMSTSDAIAAATTSAADLLGMADKIGSISVGKFADIIATERDPLSDITALKNVSFVMRDGRIHKQ